MNVGNSFGWGMGTHLAASYPYSADIGVGVVAYFESKGILRPIPIEIGFGTTLSFCILPSGCGRQKNQKIMKKILWWSAMLVWGVAVCGFTACSDNDSDGGSGGTVPDPEGTIVLQMPNDGSYSLNFYYSTQLKLDAMNNFRIINGSIMSVGKVAGLGAIRNIPSGAKWGNSTVATPGYGYIMCRDDSYVRLYVESYITSSGGTIIGAKVKYELGWTPENQ